MKAQQQAPIKLQNKQSCTKSSWTIKAL